MLKDTSSSAIVAVSDIDRARDFYGQTLGLDLIDDSMGEVLVFRTGDTRLIVYRSAEAGSNKANAAVFSAGDKTEAVVAGLAAKGVAFERYPDLGIGERQGDLYRAGPMKLAWFKDPDGNILHINGS